MFVSSRRICDPLARWMGGWMVIPQDTLEIPIRLSCNSYRNWSLWLWCILFHWVSAIMTLTNSWHFVIVAMMFLKIHLLQVTQVKRNIQDIRTIFTPLFLARLRELFGARHSSKSLTMTSLTKVVVCLLHVFTNHLCGKTDSLQEVLEVCRLHGQWDLCPSLGMEPWIHASKHFRLQETSRCHMEKA